MGSNSSRPTSSGLQRTSKSSLQDDQSLDQLWEVISWSEASQRIEIKRAPVESIHHMAELEIIFKAGQARDKYPYNVYVRSMNIRA